MVILIDNNNLPRISVKTTILQYSNSVDTIIFVCPRLYNGIDMKNFTARLQYILPVSKKVKATNLVIDSDDYNGLLAQDETATTVANGTTTTTVTEDTYISYVMKIGTTNITTEPGEVEFCINWYKTEVNAAGDATDVLIRKTEPGYIPIVNSSIYDIYPKDTFADIDQRLIAADTAYKKYFKAVEDVSKSVVTDISINSDQTKLILKSLTGNVGNGISLQDLFALIGNAIIGADGDGTQDGITNIPNYESTSNS